MAQDPFKLEIPSFKDSPHLHSGNPEIDREHEQLLSSAAAVLQAASGGKSARELQAMLDDLIQDLSTHFAHEDHQMRESGWDEAEQHAGLHRLLMAEATRLVEQHRAALVSFIDIYRFIVGSLVRDHLAMHDVEFHHFLQQAKE